MNESFTLIFNGKPLEFGEAIVILQIFWSDGPQVDIYAGCFDFLLLNLLFSSNLGGYCHSFEGLGHFIFDIATLRPFNFDLTLIDAGEEELNLLERHHLLSLFHLWLIDLTVYIQIISDN